MTDGHPADRAFAREAGITHRAVNLSVGVRVAGALHVQNVNAYYLLQWRRRASGVPVNALSDPVWIRPQPLGEVQKPLLYGDIAYLSDWKI